MCQREALYLNTQTPGLLRSSSHGSPAASPKRAVFIRTHLFFCVCLGPEVEVGCPVGLSTFFLGRVSLNAELTVILH